VPYSLVGAPSLGYDLARLPHGQQTAHVMRTALRCETEHVIRLAGRHPGAARAERWRRLEATDLPGSMTANLRYANAALEGALTGTARASAALLSRLEGAVLGNVAALDRMLRTDILDWTWVRSGDLAVQDPEASLAADVLVDAAAAGYCADSVDPVLRRAMSLPYLRAKLDLVDRAPRTGHAALDRLLDTVAGADAATVRAWRHAVDELRPGTTSWAPAMHQATWVLSLSDRLRLAADAQMAAVAVFGRAGFDKRDAAYGVWNALSGTIQATAAADLLPASDRDVLLRVWRRVYAADPPTT